MTSLLREDTPLAMPPVASATVTSWPRNAASRATASPMTPAPMTRICMRVALARHCGASLIPLPRNDQALNLVEQHGEHEADDRDHEQADIHLLDRKRLPRGPDHVAEPALGADHLGDRDQDEPDADAELEAAHDHRQRARERNGPEGLPAVGSIVAADVEINTADAEHAGGRIDDDRKEHADRHHEDFRAFAEAEDEQSERQNGAFRNRIGRR